MLTSFTLPDSKKLLLELIVPFKTPYKYASFVFIEVIPASFISISIPSALRMRSF